MMSNAAFRELGSDLGKQLIHCDIEQYSCRACEIRGRKKQTTALVRYQQIFITQKLGSICIGRHEIVRAQQAQKNFQTLKNLCHAFHWSGDF